MKYVDFNELKEELRGYRIEIAGFTHLKNNNGNRYIINVEDGYGSLGTSKFGMIEMQMKRNQWKAIGSFYVHYRTTQHIEDDRIIEEKKIKGVEIFNW